MKLTRNDPEKVWASVFRDLVAFDYGTTLRGTPHATATDAGDERCYEVISHHEIIAWCERYPDGALVWYMPDQEWPTTRGRGARDPYASQRNNYKRVKQALGTRLPA